MADEIEATLKQLFPLDELTPERIAELADKDLAGLKEELEKKLVGIKWTPFVTLVLEQMDPLLGIKIADPLLGGWSKYQELGQYTDEEQYPSGESQRVPLATHTLDSKHNASMEVRIGGKTLTTFTVTIVFALKLDGAVLVIQDGKIMQVLPGGCSASGQLALEGVVLMKKESVNLVLPAVIEFEEGIPLYKEEVEEEEAIESETAK